MILNMLEYFNLINKLSINIIYSGPIWAGGVEGIADTLKRRMAFDNLPLSAAQSVFSVFVEQMNNMLMYSADKEEFIDPKSVEKKSCIVSKGLFLVGVKDKTYFVQSGNIIRDSSISMLKSKIDHLNTLDKAGLRKLYKEEIKKENTNPESRGAGLGFIEIARRASSKIEYSFTPMGDDLSFFSLSVSIWQGASEQPLNSAVGGSINGI